MTKSSRVNRRKAVALTLALASTSAFAITSSAQADLGPINDPAAGDARVTPLGPLTADGFSLTDGLNQPAPVIALDAINQPAAGAQIRIHNQWRAGDRVLFQVRDSAGQNCADGPSSIGYSAAPTVVSSNVAYDFNDATSSPMALSVPTFGDNVDPLPDAPIASTGPQVKPQFTVNLIPSTQCDGRVNDIVEIRFTNQSVDPAAVGYDVTDAWVLSLSGIAYDVGANVTPGPLRNLPLAQDATGSQNIFNNSLGGWFGGNLAATGVAELVQERWTTTAFIVPVALTAATPGVLVADGFNQGLGTITLRESVASGLIAGTYRVCYTNNIGGLSATPIAATGPVTPLTISRETDPTAEFGDRNFGELNCIEFDVAPTSGIDTIVLSNIFGVVDAAGATTVSLVVVPDDFAIEYLTATDNGEPNVVGVIDPNLEVSNSVRSDVNVLRAPFFTVPLAIAQALPQRVGGSDRFETATKIAFNLGCNNIAVLVNGSAYPDALSATYLAGGLSEVYGGEVPILLTQTNSVPEATMVALRENGVRSVYIVGGTSVVSQQVEDELSNTRRYICRGEAFDNDQNIVVNRVAGPDRYDTNNAVIERVHAIFAGQYNNRLRYQAFGSEPSKRTALVATGANFADALIGGQFAYEKFPLILTTGGTLSPQALLTMTSIDIEQAVILGGESAVSAAVEAAIEAAGVDVIRLAGEDRYETGVAVNNWALADDFPGDAAVIAADLPYELGLDQVIDGAYETQCDFVLEDFVCNEVLVGNGKVFLARGDDFADALASAPLVSNRGGLLTLTDRSVLSPATKTWLESVDPLFNQAIALGLGQAISTAVLDAANAAIN